MLVLDSTSKSITAFLTSTPTKNPDFVATYAEASGNSFVEGSSDGALNGTTAVTLVGAPSSGVRRVVKEIIIYNRNTSSVTLTVWYVNGANGRMLWSGTLQPAETWTLSRHVLSMANWQNIGSGAPTADDDSTKGYVIGSRWIDITNGQVYVCVNATAGAAVWRNLSSALSASDGNPATAVYCDAAGRLLKPNQPAFSFYNTATDNNVTGDGTVVNPVQFDGQIVHVGNCFSNNIFTAPVTGLYLLIAQVLYLNITFNPTYVVTNIVTTTASFPDARGGASKNAEGSLTAQRIVITRMTAGDTARVQAVVFGGTKTVHIGGSSASAPYTYFMGTLLG